MKKAINEKFKNRPVEEDTQIILSQGQKLDDLNVVMETWLWEGIIGQSVILLEEELDGCDDDTLVKKLEDHIDLGEKYTISRKSEDFAFVNYGFSVI